MIGIRAKERSEGHAERSALFERKISQSFRPAFNMAYRLTGNRSEAEDLLQETYVRAFRFFHRYNADLPFNSWLYRIMTNIHIDHVRRAGKLKTVSIDRNSPESGQAWDLPDERADIEAMVFCGDLEEPFQRALRAMTPEFRTAVVLADIEGMSYEEVAEIMETSVGTVRSRIHRGRKQLRDHLETVAPDVKEAYYR